MVSYHGHGLPSDRFPVSKKKINLPLRTIKHYTMKACGGMEV